MWARPCRWRSALATSSRCEWADDGDESSHQAAAGAARLVVRARQMATSSAPRPNTTAANQTRPPRMGIRARTRRMPQPTRKARIKRSAHAGSTGQRSRPWHHTQAHRSAARASWGSAPAVAVIGCSLHERLPASAANARSCLLTTRIRGPIAPGRPRCCVGRGRTPLRRGRWPDRPWR
jgi:hypothetical protein